MNNFSLSLPSNYFAEIFGGCCTSKSYIPCVMARDGLVYAIGVMEHSEDVCWLSGESTMTLSGIIYKPKSEKDKLMDELSSIKSQIKKIEDKLKEM